MRILIVPGNDWVFGPRQYLHDIAERIGEHHDVFVWHFNLFRGRKPCVQEIKNVKLVSPWSLPSSSLLIYYGINSVFHSISFARTLRRLKIDVVIVANLIPGLWAFHLAPQRVLKVFGFQDYFPESASVYYKNIPRTLRGIVESIAFLVNKLNVASADLTLCPCFSLIDLSRKMGCRRNYFLPNGADTHFFNPAKSNEKLREKLGLTKHTLAFYGLIESWIDFETMLSGFQILKEELPDAKLLVIGSTLTNYTEELEKMIRQTHLEKDVILTGYVPNDQVPYYLNLGQVCLMPYKTDTFSGKIRLPLKLFIYSAMGKSILSVSLPEVKRLKPKHVLYYDDRISFANQAIKLLTNERLQADLGSQAREFAKGYDYSKLARDCEAILKENLEYAKSSRGT